VVIRRAGAPSPLPVDGLARARRLLDLGQVEQARAEVARLPGAEAAGGWMDGARRYVLARQALDVLETNALAGQAQPAPVAAVR
jgi:thioredoxin-like negative regulator of GroEL